MRETSIDHLNSNEGIKTIFAFSRSSRNQRSLEIKGPASLHNANYARLQYSDVTVQTTHTVAPFVAPEADEPDFYTLITTGMLINILEVKTVMARINAICSTKLLPSRISRQRSLTDDARCLQKTWLLLSTDDPYISSFLWLGLPGGTGMIQRRHTVWPPLHQGQQRAHQATTSIFTRASCAHGVQRCGENHHRKKKNTSTLVHWSYLQRLTRPRCSRRVR